MPSIPEPVWVIDGEPQYAQARTAEGHIIISSRPPEIAAGREAEPAAETGG